MRGQALQVLQGKVEGPYCEHCSYQDTGVRRVSPDGNGQSGVCLVGDSPWTEEVAAGRPFHGASGRWLDGILSKRGLVREDFLITNSLWCKPPSLGMNDEPEKYPEAQLALRQCKPYLDNLIAERKPKVLVALGNVALHRLTGFTNIEANHSYVFQSEYGIPVVPTFHPSGIIQGNHNLTLPFILAIARAMEIASGSYKPTVTNIVEDPDPSYINYPGNGDITSPLMCDIETPKSLAGRNEEEAEDDPSYQIIRMGFSVRGWEGVSFPFEGDYIRRAKLLISRAKQLIFWNKNYDLPRLKASGFELHPSVQVIDAMWAWHWLYSDLPKALSFAAPFFYSGPAWKHLASQRPGYYNGMDNSVQMGIYEGVKKQLIADGRWDRFWSHCVKVDPIYVRMGQAGVKVDKEARATFMEALEKEAVQELVKVQELLPAKLIKVQESFKELKLPKPSEKVTKRMYNSLIRIEKVNVPTLHKDNTPVFQSDGEPLMRPLWRRTVPFNPRSRPDLLELMRALGVKPPKARGEDRESVEAKYLKRLTKHPIFKHCVNYSQRTKLISTYNWPLHSVEMTSQDAVRVYVNTRKQEPLVVIQDPRGEKGLQQSSSSQQTHNEEAQSKTALWGRWMGETPKCNGLSDMSQVLQGREAYHPSLGLGRLKQLPGQSRGDLLFVPSQLPSTIEEDSSFLLPIERAYTSNDRALTTYGFHPSTWRSSSRNVNLGNIPKRQELAKLFRRLLVAEKGCKLIEIDRSAIEAVLVGFWAKSPAYINLAKAGVHSMLVSHVIGRPVPDDLPFDELRRALKAIKKQATTEQYEGCKRCIHGCVTGEHEVLTPKGWVKFSEYVDGTPIAQWDKDNFGAISFVTPSRVIRQQWDGSMIDFHGRGLSALMTPDHNVPVDANNHITIKEAKNITGGRIPVSGAYIGSLRLNPIDVRLAVAIQADSSKGDRKSAVFHLVKQRKKDRLEGLLSGRPYRKVPCKCHSNGHRYYVPKGSLGRSLELLSWDKREFSSTVYELTYFLRESFISELPYWDGSVSGPNGVRKEYINTSLNSARLIQTVCHITNRQGLLRKIKRISGFGGTLPLWSVSLNKRKYAWVGSLVRTQTQFVGTVYCVTVPSSLFLIRYNDRISVTGNSNYLLSPYGMHDEYEEFFPTEYAAQKMQDIYFGTPAGKTVRDWHKATIEEAYSKKYLDNSFQYRHYFFGPMYKFSKREKKWIVDHEGDAKRAVAFRPQADAAAIQREDLLALEPVDWFSKLLRLPTYDSVVVESPIEYVDRSIELLATQFARPIPELGGLEGFDGRIGFEIKVGSNLAPKDDSNPEGMSEVTI